MIETIVSYIIGSMIGLGISGYTNSIKNQEAIEELKHTIEDLKTQISKLRS
jgi:hypothetical protein